MLHEAPAIYILSTNSTSLKKAIYTLKNIALKMEAETLYQSDIYTVKEYRLGNAIVKQKALCTCLYILSDVKDPNITNTFLENLKSHDIDGTIYYCLRNLAVEDAIRLTQCDDITFATMKEL